MLQSSLCRLGSGLQVRLRSISSTNRRRLTDLKFSMTEEVANFDCHLYWVLFEDIIADQNLWLE